MEQLNNTINWARVESILLSHYTVGTSEEGARAYPPMMLFKCLLLQKWFRIPSDPELENQITDRLSFKTFLGLSFSQPAPDHSTFSRFRSRLPYIDKPITNAKAEALNRIIRVVKNRASGFQNLSAFTDMIFLTVGDLDLPGQIPPKFRVV
jgi:hypothetical protein